MPKVKAERQPVPSVLEIHLLGPFRLAVDGRPVEERHWLRPKPKLLVKLLALQPHYQLHREQLMELLWPDSEPEAAANNLHKAIHMARHALEPMLESAAASHFIIVRGQQVLLRAPGKVWTDVCEFERRAAEALKSTLVEAYESALELYEGDLLTEDLYEDWAAARREQLRTQYQDLLVKLTRIYEARGEHQPSIERLKELLACDSTNEESHRQLMRLYALTGNKHQALRQYQICCEALHKELAAEPEPATVELRAQIISGQLAPPRIVEAGRDTGSLRAITSLAILPLSNASNDPDAEYLSDGITENIINNLSQLPQLKVMARSTVFRFKGREIDPREAGKELGVSAVLTGRVSHRVETLNIQTELVDVRDGAQLWGEQYRRNSADIFEVQEEIAKEITEKLRLRLSGEEKVRLSRRQTDDIEAYHAYLKGRYFWNKRTTRELKKGIEYFRQAISADPGYALAYAGLSDSYTNLVTWEALPPQEGLAKARQEAARALQIDETFAEAHASLGHAMLHSWEWEEAEKEFQRAIKLSPNCAPAHSWYSEYLTAVGSFEEALAEARRAHHLDPLSLFISSDIGQVLYFARRYDEAIAQYRKTLEMEPNFFLARYQLGRVFAQKAQHAEAIEELQKALALTRKSALTGLLVGPAYAVAGRRSEALAVLDELNELSKRRYFSPYRVATIYAALGEAEQAFEWLHRAYEKRDAWLIWLKADPMLDGLRPDQRFAELERRVGLAP